MFSAYVLVAVLAWPKSGLEPSNRTQVEFNDSNTNCDGVEV